MRKTDIWKTESSTNCDAPHAATVLVLLACATVTFAFSTTAFADPDSDRAPGASPTPATTQPTTTEPSASPSTPNTPSPAAIPEAPPSAAAAEAATSTTGDGDTVATAAKSAEPKKRWPWRGAVTLRNMTSATLLTPAYEQTYLPSETLALMLTPRYAFNDTMSIGLFQYATVELTNTSNTKYRNEPQLSDTLVSFAWAALAGKIGDKDDPKNHNGYGVGLQAVWGLPTSKASIARNVYSSFGIGGNGRVTLYGVTASLMARASHNFAKSSTMEFDDHQILSCVGEGAAGCSSSLLSTGVRTAAWRLMTIGSLSYPITNDLVVSLGAGQITDWLPDLNPATVSAYGAPPTTLSTAGDQNFRAIMYWGVGVDYNILSWLSAGLGLETYNLQLKGNGTYELPFVNRNTSMYLQFAVALDGVQSSGGGALR